MTVSRSPFRIRLSAIAPLIAGAALLGFGPGAQAQTVSDEAVARDFVQAAKAQDRQTALELLDPSVSIQYPDAGAPGVQSAAKGRAFVIGYFDGLFDGRRQFELDSTAVTELADAGDVRFVAHDVATNERYALEVEVRNRHIVRLILAQPDRTPTSGVADGSPAAASTPL